MDLSGDTSCRLRIVDGFKEVQIHTFNVGGGEALAGALVDAGLEVVDGGLDSSVSNHVLLFRDPFEANLRLLFKRWDDLPLRPRKPLARFDSDEISDLLVEYVAPGELDRQITSTTEQLGLQLTAPLLLPLRQQGAQVVENDDFRVLLLRVNAEPGAIGEELERFVGRHIGRLEELDQQLVGPQGRHLRRVPKSQVKARYVTSVITQRSVSYTHLTLPTICSV